MGWGEGWGKWRGLEHSRGRARILLGGGGGMPVESD